MESLYFADARKWYNNIHVAPASDRFLYSLIFILSIINVTLSIDVIEDFKKNHKLLKKVVITTENHPLNTRIVLNHLQQDKNPALSILQFLLEKYIQNRESLLYKDNSTAAIARAIEVIRNNSSKDLVQEYIKESYSSFDDSNLSLVMSSRQKIVKIKKIEFLYSKMTYLQQLYMKFTANKLPNKAKVEFSVFTTKDEQEKNFTAYISYIFFFDEKNVKNKNLDFHVNGYRRVAE